MVPLIAAVGIGAVAYTAWSSFKRKMAELEEADRRTEALAKSKPLVRDPVTGTYRASKD
ncbi:hypothetical protein N9H93_04770 [Rhizobiaceae bacterium]|nr:hypothetical protein [Rhizobiaceae bacterium]